MTASQSSAWLAARALYRQLDGTRRRQLALTLGLMVLGALAETATVGAVLPFLAIVAPGGDAGRFAWLVAPVELMADQIGLSVLLTAALLLVAVAVVAAGLRLLLLWVSQHYIYAVAHDLSLAVYARVLHRPYAQHTMRNSAETLAAMEKVQFVLGNVLLPAMAGSTALFMALFILATLMVIDATTALLAASCFGLLYAVVSRLTRQRLYRNSDVVAASLKERVQVLQEGLGGIRDVLLDRSQQVFLDKFGSVDDRFRQAQAANLFIAAAPRHVVEAAGVVLIAIVAVLVAGRPGGINAALPVLGALALGAQRLLPLLQQAYFSWSQIHGHSAALIDIAKLMAEPLPVPRPAGTGPAFAKAIRFNAVSFAYPGERGTALRGIDLTIAHGERIGIVGQSGSGKSTFVDLLMGLLDPTAGSIEVDGRAITDPCKAEWQDQVAHVPQAIFLADSSIAANIAFGRKLDEIDTERVREAARLAEIDDFIAALPDGYATATGERGVRLSGGQRQRIGIARALYKQAGVLVFDEATSALDDATEAAVMQSVARLPRQLTLVIVAHRLSTLRLCDRIIRLDQGRIVQIGTFAEITKPDAGST